MARKKADAIGSTDPVGTDDESAAPEQGAGDVETGEVAAEATAPAAEPVAEVVSESAAEPAPEVVAELIDDQSAAEVVEPVAEAVPEVVEAPVVEAIEPEPAPEPAPEVAPMPSDALLDPVLQADPNAFVSDEIAAMAARLAVPAPVSFPLVVTLRNHGPFEITEPSTGRYLQAGDQVQVEIHDEAQLSRLVDNFAELARLTGLPTGALVIEGLPA
jgi:hypothetical protein